MTLTSFYPWVLLLYFVLYQFLVQSQNFIQASSLRRKSYLQVLQEPIAVPEIVVGFLNWYQF